MLEHLTSSSVHNAILSPRMDTAFGRTLRDKEELRECYL